MKFKNLDFSLLISVKEVDYPDEIETERLILKKQSGPDMCSFYYYLNLKENSEKIGEIALIFDGEIWYKIDKEFQNNGYMTEAMCALLNVSDKDHFLSIDRFNYASRRVAKKIGFQKQKRLKGTSSYIYK